MATRRASLIQVGQHGDVASDLQICAERLMHKRPSAMSKGSILKGKRASLITLALRDDLASFPLGTSAGAFKQLNAVYDEKLSMSQWRNDVRQNVIQNKWFDRITLLLIMLNCLFLAIEDPTANESSTRNQIVKYTDYFFTACFTIETIIKIIGLGLVEHSFSYLRDPWSVLDCFIVVAGLISILLTSILGGNNSGLGGLRAFRLLRPLRAVNHMKEVRLIVTSLLQSLPRLGDVLLLFLFFILLLAITAIQLWKGALRSRCVQVNSKASPLTEVEEGRVCTRLNNPGHHGYQCPWGWECRRDFNPYNGKVSFDNLAISFLTLFTAVTLEGWTDVMYYVMDGTTPWAAVYFGILILVGSFFISNLALVMISIAFFEAKGKEEEKMLNQQASDDALTEIPSNASEENESTARFTSEVKQKVLQVISTKHFDWCITGVIICNTLSMAIEHHGQPDDMTMTLEILNYIFTSIFGAETLLKLYGYGVKEFARDRPNLFDALIVILSLVDIVQNQISGKKTGISVLRSLRLARIFKQFPGLWATTKTILRSLEGVSVLTLLLILVIFVYGLLGMQLFGGKFCGLADNETYILAASDHCVNLPRSNFDDVGTATTTVFQVITGEDWNTVMYNGMRIGGASSGNFYCLYFVSLFVIGNYIVLNLFIAVLINNFESGDVEDELSTKDNEEEGVLHDLKQKLCVCLCCGQNERVIPISEELTLSPTSSIPEDVKHFLRALDNCETPTVANAAAKKALETPIGNVLHPQLVKAGWSDAEGEFMEYNGAAARELSENIRDNLSEERNDIETLTYVLSRIGEDEEDEKRDDFCLKIITKRVLDHHPELTPIFVRYGWSATNFTVELSKHAARELKNELELHSSVRDITRRDRNVLTMKSVLFPDVAAARTEPLNTEDDFNDRALFILPFNHPVRKVLYAAVTHKAFEAAVIFLIAVSTVSLTMANPIAAPDELFPRVIDNIDLALTICFTAEAVLKILAHGFVMHPTSYLRRDGWNRLDFVIVVFSLVAMAFKSSSGAQQLEIFRMMRTLRPLRFINKSPGLKLVVVALISSIPPMANIAFITTLVFFMFAIMGMQFFQGSFYACTDENWGDVSYPLWTLTEKVIAAPMTKEDCLLLKNDAGEPLYTWESYPDHFDHLGAALLALFQIATLEGWVVLMHLGQDAVGPDSAPQKGNQQYMALYFIIFIVVGSFFIINLFVGVLIEQYNTAKDRNDQQKWVNLSESQRQWIAVQDAMLLNTPKMNKQEGMAPWRMRLFQFVQHAAFNHFITACITINVLVMATEHVDQSSEWNKALSINNQIFLGVFLVEAIVKITAHQPQGYFQDPGNKFDFSIVLISLMGTIMESTVNEALMLSTFRVLRLARIIRVIRSAAGVRALLKTLILSLPTLVNVAGLLSLLFFLYAVLGVDLFGRVKRGQCLHEHANFDHFFNAILLLFRMTTGEAWQCIMNDCRVGVPRCSDQLGNCGDGSIAVMYFTSFMVLGMYVLLNVFIAVILSGYEVVSMEENALLTEDHVTVFYNEWEKRDPRGTRLIPIREISSQLRAVGPPLGFDDENDATSAFFRKTLLNSIGNRCCNYDSHVSYQELVTVLIEFNLFKYGLIIVDVPYWEDVLETNRKAWNALHSDGYYEELTSIRNGYAKVELSAMQIQKVWRGRKGRHIAIQKKHEVRTVPDSEHLSNTPTPVLSLSPASSSRVPSSPRAGGSSQSLEVRVSQSLEHCRQPSITASTPPSNSVAGE